MEGDYGSGLFGRDQFAVMAERLAGKGADREQLLKRIDTSSESPPYVARHGAAMLSEDER